MIFSLSNDSLSLPRIKHFASICSLSCLATSFSPSLYSLIEIFIEIITDSHAVIRNNTASNYFSFSQSEKHVLPNTWTFKRKLAGDYRIPSVWIKHTVVTVWNYVRSLGELCGRPQPRPSTGNHRCDTTGPRQSTWTIPQHLCARNHFLAFVCWVICLPLQFSPTHL